MITKHSVITAASDQVSSDLDGEAVILHLEEGVYYGLNEVGARIWQLIQAPKSLEEVYSALLEEYEVKPERCRQDLLAVLQDLDEHDLLEVRQPEEQEELRMEDEG